MTRSHNPLSPKDISLFTSHYDRMTLLYQWIQSNKINVQQFRELLELHEKEEQRQILLDSPD